jgi:F-type H+-transporting ATPase subunit gamma
VPTPTVAFDSEFSCTDGEDASIDEPVPGFPEGVICDIDDVCVDAAADEFLSLTTEEGKLAVEREKLQIEAQPFSREVLF